MDKIIRKSNMNIGYRLKVVRSVLGYSQAEVASWLGVTYQQVQKYETGASRVSADALSVVADGLGVDIRLFFDHNLPIMKREHYALSELSPAKQSFARHMLILLKDI